MLRLLKNAESNADAKNLELEELTIKNVVVQQAPVRISISALQVQLKPTFVLLSRKLADARTVPTVVSTHIKAHLAMSRLVGYIHLSIHYLHGLQIILTAKDTEVEKSRDKEEVAPKTIGQGMNRRQQARLRIEAGRA